MFDKDTASLIRNTPPLDGLDIDSLPEVLTESFAQIVTARIRLRELDDPNIEDLAPSIEKIRRIAYSNEALVAVLPERNDRRAAAFVAATAHQLCLNANKLIKGSSTPTFIGARGISSDISALLLFLIAEATADANEVSKSISWQGSNLVEAVLIESLRDLAKGRLEKIIQRKFPSGQIFDDLDPAESAAQALYLTNIKGIKLLADAILKGDSHEKLEQSQKIFRHIRQLSLGINQFTEKSMEEMPLSTFPGPCHLSSLLIAVAKDLSQSAVTQLPAPPDIDHSKWIKSLQRFATSRPYLWSNHYQATQQGYLDPGTSAVVGFPTGAGKSTLAELKINATLIMDPRI